MIEKQLKKYSASLVIREKEIKPALGYHYIPIRMAKINKIKKNGLYPQENGVKGTFNHCG